MDGFPEPGKICRRCRRLRPFREFLWEDRTGRTGTASRCAACRSRRGRSWNPTLPALRYGITTHAVDRFMERVRPDLLAVERGRAFRLARLEMRRLMAAAPFREDWPSWVGEGRGVHGDETVGFLEPEPGVIFLVSADPNPEHRVIVTVLSREGTAGKPGR